MGRSTAHFHSKICSNLAHIRRRAIHFEFRTWMFPILKLRLTSTLVIVAAPQDTSMSPKRAYRALMSSSRRPTVPRASGDTLSKGVCQVLRQTQELNVLACLGSRERLFERFFLLLGGGVLLERRYRGTALVAIGNQLPRSPPLWWYCGPAFAREKV